MDVDVQVWHLLERGLANRVPETQALIWKSTSHCTSDARNHGHECGARRVIKLAHIVEMPSRNDKRMARVKLPWINGSQCQVILADDAGWCAALRNVTKNASVSHRIPPSKIQRLLDILLQAARQCRVCGRPNDGLEFAERGVRLTQLLYPHEQARVPEQAAWIQKKSRKEAPDAYNGLLFARQVSCPPQTGSGADSCPRT